MSDNVEALIETAAGALSRARRSLGDGGDEQWSDRLAARVVLDVLEGVKNSTQNSGRVPSDTDRKALVRIICSAVYGEPDNLSRATEAADEILAAGFRRSPEPQQVAVTDEMVERGAYRYWLESMRDVEGDLPDFDWGPDEKEQFMWAARTVLDAALLVAVPRQVGTVAELEALPVGTIIRMGQLNQAWEKVTGGNWGTALWSAEFASVALGHLLPGTVLWVPDTEGSADK